MEWMYFHAGMGPVSYAAQSMGKVALSDDDNVDADDEDDDWDEYVDEGGSSDEDDSSESLKKHRQNKLQSVVINVRLYL